MALDRRGDLFVANIVAPSVTEYAPPFGTAMPTTISAGLTAPWALALDYDGDLFVSNIYSNGPGIGTFATAAAYSPPYSSQPTSIAAGDDAALLLAADNDDNIHIAQNCQCGVYGPGGLLFGFAPPYSASPYSSAAFYNPWTVLITP